MKKILVIDDEKSILDLLSVVFTKEGYLVNTAMSAVKAFELIEKEDFALIITDIKLPEKSGLDILKFVKKKKPEIPVVMITAFGTIKQTVEAFKMGALDYVVKPFDVEELKIVVAKGMEKERLKEENTRLRSELNEKHSLKNMVGKSRALLEISSLIEKVSSVESTVLISGESGTGKEVAARAIHYYSPRREHPFVSINCGALSENLLESELFGHVKGSFTGAIVDKKGMFEMAGKGTIFLDEIGETTPMTQVKLLRALEERKVRRVGGTVEIPLEGRIVAATNQILEERIKEGKFREDLFYRLNVISFEMPPLRQRKEDVPLLAAFFLKKYCAKMGKQLKRFTPGVMNVLESYHWPGNVRELENVIERVVAIEDRETITEECLPDTLFSSRMLPKPHHLLKPGFSLNETLDEISRGFVQEALLASGDRLKETAEYLGINYRSLRYLIEKFDLRNTEREIAKNY
ncbi:MAG: sigma-54 dependent transcriptional regulator [Candidatus Aminicenantes bacterium]|nr:sigma-54 dependent transcriptional regulator [Candidatus Aminicenantes bacterium]